MPSGKKKNRSKSGTENVAGNSRADLGTSVAGEVLSEAGPAINVLVRAKGKKAAKKRKRPRVGSANSAFLLSATCGRRSHIGEAQRERGLDEHAVAGAYVHVVEALAAKTDSTGNVEKLLVDVLKECSRHLGPPPERSAASDPPVVVQLIHNVPRPERLRPALLAVPEPPDPIVQ